MIEACELVIRQPGHPERVVRLQEGVTRLGRAEDNDVVLSDVGVSRRHARLVVTKDQVRVEDLGSGNGTYYRGFRIQNQQVEDGDELVVDPFVLQVRIRGATRRPQGEPTTPQGGSAARLDVVSGAGLAKTYYPIGSRGLTIGRSETRDVVIPDPAASRHHCSIIVRESSWMMRDMGSANGVFVNGARVRESVLSEGDRIRIGNTELRFTMLDATQADSSTTQRVPEPNWKAPPAAAAGDNEWTESEVSLPVPETVTPQQPRRRAPAQAKRGGSRLAIGAGVAFVLLALFAMFTVVVVIAAVIVVIEVPIGSVGHDQPPVRPVAPPTWQLDLPGGLPAADVATLQKEGAAAIKANDARTALQDFYRVLQGEPGKPTAERFAFFAGEYLILDQVEKELVATAQAHQQRDKLIEEVRHNTHGAAEELAAKFKNDPVATAVLGSGPDEKKLTTQLAAAAQLASTEKWAEAADQYAAVLAATGDATTRMGAETGLMAAHRELARAASAAWTAAMKAEDAGNTAEARKDFEAVLVSDPKNPSARLHLAALGK